jgi:hypothetical protein
VGVLLGKGSTAAQPSSGSPYGFLGVCRSVPQCPGLLDPTRFAPVCVGYRVRQGYRSYACGQRNGSLHSVCRLHVGCAACCVCICLCRTVRQLQAEVAVVKGDGRGSVLRACPERMLLVPLKSGSCCWRCPCKCLSGGRSVGYSLVGCRSAVCLWVAQSKLCRSASLRCQRLLPQTGGSRFCSLSCCCCILMQHLQRWIRLVQLLHNLSAGGAPNTSHAANHSCINMRQHNSLP